jgi:hypothetical protein
MASMNMLLVSMALCVQAPFHPGQDPQIGQTFEIPYRVTLTNHYLIRIRINEKGPFHFLVDTGAPALYVSTETARKIGLQKSKQSYWTPIDKLELEGGAVLHQINARVEDPFQLEGMNALGLPGTTIDGILGYTVLARFRMEFDPTRDRLKWTRLDFEPKDPFVPDHFEHVKPPAEVQMMSALGPMMKLMAVFIGKQPEDAVRPQGILGIEIEQRDGKVWIREIQADSPAANAKLQPGDELIKLNERAIRNSGDAHDAIKRLMPEDRVPVTVRRADSEISVELTAAKGF